MCGKYNMRPYCPCARIIEKKVENTVSRCKFTHQFKIDGNLKWKEKKSTHFNQAKEGYLSEIIQGDWLVFRS